MDSEKDFFFISYSHNDSAVSEDVSFFDDCCANYWIDMEMRGTDESWLKRVIDTLAMPHCKGAVFYLSENSLASEAIEKEFNAVLAKIENTPDFFILVVLIEGRSVSHLVKKTYMKVDDDSLLKKTLPLSRLVVLGKLFTDEKIFLKRFPGKTESYYKDLYTNLSDKGVILNKENVEKRLANENKLDAYSRFDFGMFYDPEIIRGIPILQFNSFVEKNGKWYIKLVDQTVHHGEPIKWIILDCQQGIVRMITEKPIAKIPGQDIDRWLNNDFRTIAFNDDERQKLIGSVKTLTFDEYDCYMKQQDINPTRSNFWLDSINDRNQKNMLMCVVGEKVFKHGMQKSLTNGIRPVIEINEKDLIGG